METIRGFGQEQLICLLKDLLSAPEEYRLSSKSGVLKFKIKANHFEVQRAIFEWLSVPERKHNLILMGGKGSD